MKIKLYKSLWEAVSFYGQPLTISMDDSIENYIRKIKESGYDGIECPLPGKEQESYFRQLLDEYDLEYIAQVLSQGDHEHSFATQVERAVEFNPIMIVSQSAKDSMPYEQQVQYFQKAVEVEKTAGISVAHETHRGRALFNPWHTVKLLNEIPELKLNADFSHWCCVCESLLADFQEDMKMACERSIHIHGRVGYSEGPQVPDPRAPEYEREWKTHLSWWEQIAVHHQRQGIDTLSFTPEFGPPGYMHTLPFTRQPVADIWDLNLWTAQTVKAHLQKFIVK
jgi:sugar phosphate isomerase/epimerase